MPSERLRFGEIRATSAFRTTLLMGVVFLAGVIAMLALIYGLTGRELTRRSDRILIERARSLLATPPDRLPDGVRSEIANAVQGVSYFALLDRDGNRLVGNIEVHGTIPMEHPFNATGSAAPPLRVLAVRTPPGETILLGRDISQIRDLRQRILEIVIGVGIAGLIGMFAAAVALSLHPLRRVRDLERASRAIAAGKLETRMPIAGTNDELDQIAATVNLMIEEVGHVIAQVKATSDAIAHDLRTPLTRVRAQLHHVQHAPGLDPEQAERIERATRDLDLVLARFAALLRISEIETSERRSRFAPVALAALLDDALQLYGPLAEETGIRLSIETGAAPIVRADEKLLFEAIGNLIDNAIKFTRSRVVLRVGRDRDAAILEVVDDGPGIAADQREAVLRRFYRSPEAASVPGSGLGLSFVAAILHLHGFTLQLDDADPGLIARVRM